MADLVYYTNDGQYVSAIQCPAGCDHHTPPDGICVGCQPFPTAARCDTCRLRGPIPTVTTTIAPGLMNDDPTTQIIVNPGGHEPPGRNA